MDGDGQHNPIYISKMFKVFLKNKTDFVIGVRKFKKKELIMQILS